MEPKILSYEDALLLKNKHPEVKLISETVPFIEELFDIEFPEKKDTKTKAEVEEFKNEITNGTVESWGVWVYYPWLRICLHLPPETELRALRTSRNRNLITAEEQKKLYSSTIYIAGMSVGSNVVEALVSQGIGSRFILADMDIIEPSNLNRIRSPLHHIGLHKVEAISRKVWEIDPFIEIVSLKDGVNETNIEEIFETEEIDIIIDEMDSLAMKVLLREKAKQKRLPIIMAADDGDDALIDIERYDLEPEMEIFGGLIPQQVIAKIKLGDLPRAELGMLIGKYFIGPDNIPLRMYESLKEVGKSLPSWPQLGGAAALSGISLAFAAKKILLGEALVQGRTLVSVTEKLAVSSESELKELKKYQKMFGGEVE